jgi:hypothetical protein
VILVNKEIQEENGRSYRIRFGISFPSINLKKEQNNRFVGRYNCFKIEAPTNLIIEDSDVYNHYEAKLFGFGMWFTLTVGY